MWLTQLVEAMHGRILGFNVSVAHVWRSAIPTAEGRQAYAVEDSYIAAIARRHNLTVATGNVKDFQRPGVKVFTLLLKARVSKGISGQSWSACPRRQRGLRELRGVSCTLLCVVVLSGRFAIDL